MKNLPNQIWNQRINACISVIIIICAFLTAAGCSDDKNPVREYGSTLTGAIKKADKAKANADLLTIKMEIMRYKAESGEFPLSLHALNMKDIYIDFYEGH